MCPFITNFLYNLGLLFMSTSRIRDLHYFAEKFNIHTKTYTLKWKLKKRDRWTVKKISQNYLVLRLIKMQYFYRSCHSVARHKKTANVL